MKNLLALSLAISFAVGIYLIPIQLPILLISLIKIAAFGTCYGYAIIRFNVSQDLTELWLIISKRIRSFLS